MFIFFFRSVHSSYVEETSRITLIFEISGGYFSTFFNKKNK